MALNASRKKLGRAHTSSLIAQLKALEQKETNTSKRIRRQEITKLRFEINHIDMKNYIKNQNKQKNKQKKQTKKKPKNKKQKP